MSDYIMEALLEKVDRDRRDAVAQLIAGSGYAAPEVSSFSMDNLSEFDGFVLAGNMLSDKP